MVGWQTGQEDILVLPMNIHSLIHLCKRCLPSSYYVTDTVASGDTVMIKKDIVPMLRGISKDTNPGLGDGRQWMLLRTQVMILRGHWQRTLAVPPNSSWMSTDGVLRVLVLSLDALPRTLVMAIDGGPRVSRVGAGAEHQWCSG